MTLRTNELIPDPAASQQLHLALDQRIDETQQRRLIVDVAGMSQFIHHKRETITLVLQRL